MSNDISNNNGRNNRQNNPNGPFSMPLWSFISQFGTHNPLRTTPFDRAHNRLPLLNALLHKPYCDPEYVDFPFPENFAHLKGMVQEECGSGCRSRDIKICAEHCTRIGARLYVVRFELRAGKFGRFRDEWLRNRRRTSVVKIFWYPGLRRALGRLMEEAEEFDCYEVGEADDDGNEDMGEGYNGRYGAGSDSD